MDRETVDVGNIFADAPVVKVGCETVDGNEVLASTDADEGRGAVDGDRDSDDGDERVREWGIALPNERGDEIERPRLRLRLGLKMFGDIGADNDTDDRAGVLSGVVTSPLVVSPLMEVSCH